MTFSKFLALSALLGLMATLPVKSAEILVTVGGPGGVVQYSPNNVVGYLYAISRLLPLDKLSITRLPMSETSSPSTSCRRITQ